MSLVIPALASELDGVALPRIVDELRQVSYLGELIVGLDSADRAQFDRARGLLERVPARCRVLWNDGPRLQAINDDLLKHDLAPMAGGKGRNVWYCLGYFLASGRGEVVALHDADVVTYSREMLARLLYPVAHPTFGYAFCKGYYFRVGDNQLTGRVSRMLVEPLIRSLREVLGPSSFLDYIGSFRYPLAGEYAMEAGVARSLSIPFDWGLEIGVLSEIHRSYTGRRICQVDLADEYDHKHQELSADDPGGGLHRMGIEIAKALFRKLAASGEVFTPAVFQTLKAAYRKHALDLLERYQHDAEMNGYHMDRHYEEELIDVFSRAVMTAGDHYLSQPMELPLIPSWVVVHDAMPDVFDRLLDAVEADNA